MLFEVDFTGARTVRMSERFLETLARLVVRHVPEAKGKRVSVSFVSTPKMRMLNCRYRRRDASTDVLSFSAIEGEKIPGEADFAGDIILCLPYIRTSAKEQGVRLEEEIVRMFVHGAMHCLGYDHMNAKDEARMIPLQEKIIALAMEKYEA